MNKLWFIYKITNIVNKKLYIGQTVDPKTRWSRHKSDARLNKKYNYHLYDAIRKYGVENFIFEIVACCKTIEDADFIEIYCIKQFNSTDREFGYNKHMGGQSRREVTEETKKKISESNKGRTSPMLGQHHSNETKEILSAANKGNQNRLGSKVSDKTKQKLRDLNLGRTVSEQTLDKMSQSMIGKNSGSRNGMFGKRSPLAKLTMDDALKIRVEYNTTDISMLDLSKKYFVSKKTILNVIHNKIYVRNS